MFYNTHVFVFQTFLQIVSEKAMRYNIPVHNLTVTNVQNQGNHEPLALLQSGNKCVFAYNKLFDQIVICVVFYRKKMHIPYTFHDQVQQHRLLVLNRGEMMGMTRKKVMNETICCWLMGACA